MRKKFAALLVLAASAAGVWATRVMDTAASSAASSSEPPTISVAQAQQIALVRASSAGDATPQISTSAQTLGETSTPMHAPPDAALGEPSTPTYLVTMRGSFVMTDAHLPKGAAAPTGNTMQVVMTRAGFVLGIHLGNE